VIRVKDLNHYFGEGETRKQVLFHNGLDIQRGEIIIMTGPSGSGKTTLCKRLRSVSVSREHIRLDNYFKSPRTFPRKGAFRNWERPSNLKFDVLLKHLKMLRSGKKVHTMTFPKRAGAKREPIILNPGSIIFVEGFVLFKDKKVRDMLDLKIYLDIHPDIMLSRRAVRFGAAHVNDYDTKVAIPEFLKYGVAQKRFADHIVDAGRSQAEVIKEVKMLIKRHMGRGKSR